jgi:hypothetical protein
MELAELASVVITNGPEIFTRVTAEFEIYCERKGIARLAGLIGTAADQALSYSELPATATGTYPWEK